MRFISISIKSLMATTALPAVLLAGAGTAHAGPHTPWEPRGPEPTEIVGVPAPPPRSFADLAAPPAPDPTADTEVKKCKVQNDGSTWCDYYFDGKFATHGCFSDWDGAVCNGDEKED